MTAKNLILSAGSGEALPAGAIGETISANATAVTAVFGVSGNVATIASITLPAGTWLISAFDVAYNNARPPGGTISAGGSDLYDGTSTISLGQFEAIWYAAATAGDCVLFSTKHVVPYTTTTQKTISFRLRCDSNSGTPTNASCTSRGFGYVKAVRIA
jgi:hypothetical protein